MWLELNGEPFQPDWPDTNDCTFWRGSFWLEPGVNEAVITAYDYRGNLLAADTITVIYDPNPGGDTDGDGLTDLEELVTYHTDRENPDTDGDLVTDFEEVMIVQTDPLDPNSTPHAVISEDRLPDGRVSISWRSIPGRYYQVGCGEDMVNWVTASDAILAEALTTTWIDSGPPNTKTSPAESSLRWRFYRITLLPWDFIP